MDSVVVDEIRVETANGPADRAPVIVAVSSGRFSRKLPVAPSSGRALRFTPGLSGDTFTIELDPVFERRASTCVTRVTLLSQSRELVTIQP